jgi:hypothetical protein
MGTVTREVGGTALTRWPEICDKCGAPMALKGSGHDFERWQCPTCRQVIGIDRDPSVAARVRLHRGYPWLYSPDGLRT